MTGARGFSLLELLVVLAVTVILTSLLFPAFRGVRESALRLRCAAHQRQIGTAIVLYAADHGDRLPPSRFAAPGPHLMPQEMMAATLSVEQPAATPYGDWEGLGWLIGSSRGSYLDSCACLYCPAHHGEHPFERYQPLFNAPTPGLGARIYTNYQYRGDRELGTNDVVRFRNAHEEILVSDGLRTRSDFNHIVGGNLLHGDGAVTWFEDTARQLLYALPVDVMPQSVQVDQYKEIWSRIAKMSLSDASE
ncbi:MAG TPA: prepilin-type N-terminal cleavage/methylation domain-containing protein [Phycisphaerales bacterium]|nr:prepilin-type N-terminal cleavage/methylation domain-containing protein [Phycisphaerales bacterium]HMP36032.1 prepilin-type N-terminal cleavage/methylation domain-containing protein [Phycisphaerales bacterium]